jgi:hypothetical protein
MQRHKQIETVKSRRPWNDRKLTPDSTLSKEGQTASGLRWRGFWCGVRDKEIILLFYYHYYYGVLDNQCTKVGKKSRIDYN